MVTLPRWRVRRLVLRFGGRITWVSVRWLPNTVLYRVTRRVSTQPILG